MAGSVEEQFRTIGARAKITRVPVSGMEPEWAPVQVNIVRDSDGEVFDIDRLWNVSLAVMDANTDNRDLLLVAEHQGRSDKFSRFLCGHDEKAWFVAAIPERFDVASVAEAKDALKPQEVWTEIREHDLPRDQWNLRWNAAFLRQGEWFFLPRPWMEVDHREVYRNEPISRSGGKPHWCEYVYRLGGVRVFVNHEYPEGLTEAEFEKLDFVQRRQRRWEERTRDAQVYARGLISHPDHATIELPYWHQVVMNTETQARAMRHVAFLD